jgi:2-dehydro-3-deoxygluconokinase
VVKQGATGALVAIAATGTGDDTAMSVVSQPALPVRVVDAIGAGDSFTAGYPAARCDRLPPAERLRWGTIAAAYAVGAHGDWEGLPTPRSLGRACVCIRCAERA